MTIIHKRVVIILSCMLCIIPFILCLNWDNELIEIEEYNNDIFTREIYEKITRIEYIAPDETVYARNDSKAIHDAYSLLASLRLTEHDNGDIGGFCLFKIYVKDQSDYIVLSMTGEFLGVNTVGYVANKDICHKLKSIFLNT